MALKKSYLFDRRHRRSVQNNKRHLRTLCAAAFENFESRRMLAGYFNQIADEISGPSGVLTQVSSGIDRISSVAKLPLINMKLDQVDRFNESLEKFRSKLDSELRTLTPSPDGLFIKSEIVRVLGPGGANVLANRADPAKIGPEDVTVQPGDNSVDVVIDLGISDVASFASSLGLGIDSVPLKPSSGTNGAFKAGVFYRNFRFGYNPTKGPYVDTSASNELELELKGFLPDSFSAGLGFLNVKVTDSSPGEDPGDEDVTISLKANVTDTGITAPALGIDLDFQAHINVQTTFEGMPELATNFKLQWEMPAISPDAPLDGGGWKAPILEFNDVTLSVGSFVKSLAQPIAKYVKDVIEPLEPVFNLLETRIPGISDVAETFGQSSINLISLSNLLALSPNPPTQFIDAMRSAAKLRDLYATLTSLADRNAAGLIRLGNFSVSGPDGKSLLNTSAALSNLGLPDWSSLVTNGGGFNFEETKRLLRSELGAVGGEIADVLTKIASKAGSGGGDKAGFSFSFPIIENPSKVALGMFLGRDENLVSVGLDINLAIKKDYFIKIVPGVSILIRPNASVNAATEIGYDTRGLREAMKTLYDGPGFDPNKLLNGLWISGSTHIDVSGSVGVGPVLGLPDFATVDLVLDVGLNVHAGLYIPPPGNLPPNADIAKRRFFTGDFNEGKLFTLSGEGKASLSATIKVGGELPLIGFVGISKTWTFFETTFFRFSTDSVPMPGSMVNRPVIQPKLFVVETFGEGQKVLRLNTAGRATLRDIAEDEKDEDFTIEVVGYAFRLGQRPAFVPVIDVKAFGIVQRYTGQVDYVQAEMGDGNDTVKVKDGFTKIRYSIHGDEGNDNINVDGNVPVWITGGDGDDTIDGGNGTAPTGSVFWDGVSDGIVRVDGGNGSDKVSFGDGRLENVDPSALYYEVLNTSTDSIRDVFRIDNERSQTDTEYQFDTAGAVFGDLLIQPKTGGAPRYAFRFHATVALEVLSGTGDDEFLGYPTAGSSLYGGYGDDVFRPLDDLDRLPTRILGGAGVYPSFNVNFYGGNDHDVLIVDDSRNTTPREYNINSDNWSNADSRLHWTEVDSFDSGVIRFSGIDDFTFKSGSKNDSILISGVITAGLTIDSGSGDDRIVVGYLGPAPVISGIPHPNPGSATIHGPMTINSGTGNDSFELNNVSNRFMEYETIEVVFPDGSIGYRQVPSSNFIHHTVPVNLEGGEGNNTLQIDDRQRRLGHPGDINETNYQIEYDQFLARTIYEADDDAAIHFSDVELRSVLLSNNPVGNNNVNIVSLGDPNGNAPPPDLVVPFAIFSYQGLDRFTLVPHDGQGHATLLRPIAINGGSNNDQLVINDSNSSQPTTYTFGGDDGSVGSFQQYIGGITPGQLTYSTNFKRVEISAGNKNDAFYLDFTGSIRSLFLSGGLGDDVFEVSPNRKDVALSIDPDTFVAIDGGDGSDSFGLSNNNSSIPWFYIRTGNALSLLSPGEFRLETTPLSLESWTLNGGTQRDAFYLADQASGETTIIDGAAGLDTLLLGFNGYTRNIHGQIVFDGGIDGGMLSVLDPTNTTGVTAHIDGGAEGTIGSAPGDTLFGVGGSVVYRNLADDAFGDGFGLTLQLGFGADTIYAVPHPTATTSINAGEPSEGDGDVLYLGLNQAQNAVIQNFGNGNGRVTSSNLKPIEWYSVEQLNTDYVAPTSILVTNTLDSGPGSLRQAILDANAKANMGTADVIRFNIPGVSAHTIRPLSPLPFITDPVVLDATTQPGYAGKPVIELDGTLAGRSNGLVIVSGGSTVRGFAINRFSELSNIEFLLGGGNVIQGNYIGTNLAGNAVYPMASPTVWGVVVYGSDNNIVGTDGDGVNDEVEGNVISGHGGAGILFESGSPELLPDNNVIAGNRIGTNADGNSVLANGRMGLFFLSGGTGNRIGTNSDGISDSTERNIISGNPEAGIYLTNADANVIAGNYIGTNAAGGGSLGNGDGIVVNLSNNNRIGGTQPGAGNIIANSAYAGVILSGGNGTGNSILGNSLFNNARLGINLQSPNEPGIYYVTPNDAGDTDSGVNNLQNFPEITSALATSTQTVVGGKLQSTPRTQFRIEFFSSIAKDVSGYGEGQTYLGFITTTTDNTGVASFVANFRTLVPAGQFISATATDPLGNTSEFSLSAAVAESSSLSNVVTLQLPTSSSVFLVTSPVGTSLTASVKSTAGVTPPNGFDFPYGFLDFTLRGIAPGTSSEVTISGLDLNQIRDYYKFGPTPGNRAAHWYSFLLGQGNPSDNPAGTGMEIVGGTMILRLVDGKRGDDDLTANGVIVDIGGAVRNRAPVATNDSATIEEDSVLTIDAKTLTKNDRDLDGDKLVFTAVGKATNGTVTLVNGVVKFIPTQDFNGNAGFVYTISDGYITAEGRVTVVVTEVNDAPTANRDTATVLEDRTVDIEVRTNDTKGPANESGQSLTVIRADALHGSVSINRDGTLRYRPTANYFGTDTITYIVEDNGKTNGKVKPLSARGTVVVTVTSVNDAPIGDDLNVWVNEDDSVRVKLSGTDIETQSAKLKITVTTLPAFGQLLTQSGAIVKVGDSYTGATTLVYRPGAAREGAGTDRFKYTVTDSEGAAFALSDEATVVLNIAKAVEDGRVTVDSNGILRIGGTNGNDDIVATKSGNKLKIKINGKVVCDDLPMSRVLEIRTWGRGGNDKINLSEIDVPTLINGGTGDDELRGGARSNLIFGGEGNDRLYGGAGTDLVIGGSGVDTFTDSQGNDVMFGGNVSNQLTDGFFREVLQQWNGSKIQNSRFKQSLIDDSAVDSFFDSQGDDWYLLGATDLSVDLYAQDRDLFERVIS